MAKLLVVHGPNLNLLGSREPRYYGSDTLDTLNQRLQALAQSAGHNIEFAQSNAEHLLIERIHAAKQEQVDFIILNPAAFTHTSIALRDALLGIEIPFIEVHLSNIYAREPFRQKSYFSDIAAGVISGFGTASYELALQAILHRLNNS